MKIKNKLSTQKWKEAAATYLDLGWSLIPVNCEKKPLVKWKKHQSVKANSKEILRWLRMADFSGLAVVTGKISNVVVLDIDKGSKFDTSWIVDTPKSITPSEGFHYYFRLGKDIVGNATGFELKTDFRGEGGYAILPPSWNNEGRYHWEVSPRRVSPTLLPKEIKEKIVGIDIDRKKKNKNYWGVEKSQRNESAAVVVGKLLSRHPEDEWESVVWPLLKGWNSANKPPLPEAELRSVFDSISSKEAINAKSGKKNQSQILIELVTKSGSKLIRNEFNEPCIVFPNSPFIAYKISSKHTEMYLYKIFYESCAKAPYSEAVTTTINQLKSKAYFDGPKKDVFNRVGRKGDKIYYDIGDNEHVIKISSKGWEIVKKSPVLFHRYSHQKIQVLPKKGGNLRDLLHFTNVSNQQQEILLMTYVIVALIPDIPRVMLLIFGDQGAAKSTSLRFIRSLIDPSHVPLLTPPTSQKELVQSASHNYALMLDNLTNLPDWLSDSLCRIITGDGFSKRQLYTNDSDVLYSYKRVTAVSGITQVSDKPDLLDRSILLELDRITDDKRQDEQAIWKNFLSIKPRLLGAVFDVLSATLDNINQVKTTRKPRMADYYKHALAAANYLGFTENDLLNAFQDNVANQNAEAIEQSPVAQTIITYMKKKTSVSMRSSELYEALSDIAEKLKIIRGFPKTSNWLWRKIKRVRPNLAAYGIVLNKERQEDGTYITIVKDVKEAEQSNLSTDEKDINNVSNCNNDNNVDQFEEMVRETLM